METRANVQSTDAIETVRTALVMFVDQVADALSTLDVEMRRIVAWLEHDRPAYWRTQMRLASDQVHEAQAALHRCLMFPINDERPSCYEERAALKRAQSHLAYCQEKTERVRHWTRTLRHELFEYQGRVSQLVRLVEIEAPEAIGVLGNILRRLEEYQSVRASHASAGYDDAALADELLPETPASGQSEADTAAPAEQPEISNQITAAATGPDVDRSASAAPRRTET